MFLLLAILFLKQMRSLVLMAFANPSTVAIDVALDAFLASFSISLNLALGYKALLSAYDKLLLVKFKKV